MRLVSLILIPALLSAQTPQAPEPADGLARFSGSSNLVIVNVTVKGRDGQPVGDLKREDFRIFEDGKPQELTVFEFQRLDPKPLAAVTVAPPAATAAPSTLPAPIDGPRPSFKDRRLLVLFFDFSSMPIADQIRAQDAAVKFLSTQMTAADLVAIYTFSSKLKQVVDFTDDRTRLLATIQGFGANELLDTETADATAIDAEDDGSSFSLDETEFAVFNTDRKLGALEDLAKEMTRYPEKKAVVYFSSGVSKTGVENQSQLRATTNAAVRANLSFYPIDARGLVAMAPAGDASKAGSSGTGLYSGKAQQQGRDKFNDQQETLYTLAGDTGGKALLDSNDLTLGIRQAQRDVESYYTLGYYSSNETKDGRFRKIKVELPATARAKLDYRPGYFADKVWAKLDEGEREKQLADALQLGNPVTDLPMAVQLLYFRINKDSYFVPLAVKIPGSKITLGKNETTELDFIGSIKDAKGRTVSTLRDTLKLKLKGENSQKLGSRNLVYDAGFTLAPGEYRVKVLARENETGQMGTFEARFEVPNLDAAPTAHLSSLVLAAQREPLSAAIASAERDKKLLAKNPLVTDNRKLIPSVTNVFRSAQTLHAFAEVYGAEAPLATLAIYQGKRKIYESTPRQLKKSVEFELPLARLAAGEYTAQLNLIDPGKQRFAFARESFVIASK